MKVHANGLQIEVDDQGPVDGRPLLLIMGLGMQLIAWPDEFVSALVKRGFRVIRFDNRDIGLSQGFDEHGVPSVMLSAMRYALRLRVPAFYTLRDMAQDALGVLDALGVPRAHVCGASMGGMIAQHLAAGAPSRVASVTLMMTTTGARWLPKPSPRVGRVLMSRPMGPGEEAAVAWAQSLFTRIGSPGYPTAPDRRERMARAFVRRAWHPAGAARQLLAVMADDDRSPLLPRITSPALVIHGVDDPLVPVACGQQLARGIAGAQADLIDGMGHDLPEQLFDRFADGIARNASRNGRG